MVPDLFAGMGLVLYEQLLAAHLGEPACRYTAVVAQGITRRFSAEDAEDERRRPYVALLARRLLDPTDCPASAALPEGLRTDLRRILMDSAEADAPGAAKPVSTSP